MALAKDPVSTRRRTPAECDRSHPAHAVDVAFGGTNLLPDAGLVPLLAPVERAGPHDLLEERLTVADNEGVSAHAPDKTTTSLGGVAAGADSADDLDVPRHGATPAVFTDVTAPSRVGSRCGPTPSAASASWTPSPVGC